MKDQILVPTDFSECAGFAAAAAMQLAERFDADIHFLTVWDLPENQVLMDKKKAALAMLESKYAASKRIAKVSYREGKLTNAIEHYIHENGINLVIMGSHGSSGFSEILIGSTTQKVVRNIHCPVLVIKEPVDNLDFQNIIFASDFTLAEQVVFKRFLEFIKMFSNPHIHLVAVNTSSFFIQPQFLLREAMHQFKELVGEMPCTTHIEYNFSIEEGVEQFANTMNADLIVVSNQQRSTLRRMLIGSTVEALINHATIPVLSLDF